ncbi:MAG: hypothetical protein DRH56_03215 [Deltaproteobacteria bacterium]|nr:MAG: hypothetical protein DRH56_03215 [Deltaproteobacteria bacterium]
MKHFMEPESVAIVGVSRKSGAGSFNLLENMLRFGYRGKIFPVNPAAGEILGIPTYADIRDIGRKIDLAVISLPREKVPARLRECMAAGVRAVIVVSQGFSDADERGKRLQREMVTAARENGVRILGPNTLGVINGFSRFTTSFMPLTPHMSPVSVICQSGVFFVGAGSFTGPVGKGIDLGNGCDIGFRDALEYFGSDPDTRLIAIHMEGLTEGRSFLSLAERVVREKPVVVYKTGQSDGGARAAASHSGAMAGDYRVCRDALRQAGALVLDRDGDMRDAIRTLRRYAPMKGNRVAVITPTGAGGIMAGDALERRGLRLAALSESSIHSISRISPGWMPLGNPLDIWPAVMRKGLQSVYGAALAAVLEDPGVDGILCICIAPDLPDFAFLDVSEVVNRVVPGKGEKPVVVWLYGPGVAGISRKFEADEKIVVYRSIEKAVMALSLLFMRHRLMSPSRMMTGGTDETD